jgi:predicted kinase
VTEGFVRDCHGDLHLDHVVILNGIFLIDCIEFNDRFRYGDTAADLGFLLMDFDFRGYPAFARRVADGYTETSGDREILGLLGFYKSYRAFVRGKVEGFTLDEPEISSGEKELAVRTAGHYFSLSLAFLKPPPPPALIITVGLTGAGKSFLATRLGKRLGIRPIRSDVLRKELHGIDPSQHQLDKYGRGIYRANATAQTYRGLLQEARRYLRQGQSVILDASFMSGSHRMEARNLAEEAQALFRIVECSCPEQVVRARLQNRMNQLSDPSNGRWEIFLQQKERFEPIRGEELGYCRRWDSTSDPNAFLMDLVRELIVSQ